MKKTIILAITIFVILTLGCIGSKFIGKCYTSSNNAFTGKLTGTLQEADLIFDLPKGIKIGNEFTNSLKEKLGKPLKVDEYYDEGYFKNYYYQGYILGISISDIGKDNDKEIITSLDIQKNIIKTNRGLTIGDPKNKVIEKYGSCNSIETTDKELIYRYFFETKLGEKTLYRTIFITISINTNKVTDIYFT